MLIAAHLVPGDNDPGTVAAKDGVRRVFQVAVRVVADLCRNRLRIMAGEIALHTEGQVPPALGVGVDLTGVVPQL